MATNAPITGARFCATPVHGLSDLARVCADHSITPEICDHMARVFADTARELRRAAGEVHGHA